MHRRLLHLLLPLAAALALTTAPAGAAVELGAGTVNAGLSYYPTLGTACLPTTVDVEGGLPENPTVVVGTGTSPYAGWFSFDGTGQSPCESLVGGSGSLRIWGNGGFVGDSNFHCGSYTTTGPQLAGSYVREGAVFAATLSGTCWVDSQAISVQALISGTWLWELNHGTLYGTIVFTEI